MNASAAINFPRLDGLTLKDSSVEIHGYMNKSVYLPQEEATKTFERLSASNTKGAYPGDGQAHVHRGSKDTRVE